MSKLKASIAGATTAHLEDTLLIDSKGSYDDELDCFGSELSEFMASSVEALQTNGSPSEVFPGVEDPSGLSLTHCGGHHSAHQASNG